MGPGGPHTAALPAGSPQADRRGRSWLPMAAIALVAALIGGAVVLGGQQLLSRTGTLGSSVPAPGPGSTARPDGSIAKIAADALPSVVTSASRRPTAAGPGPGSSSTTRGTSSPTTTSSPAAGGGGQDHGRRSTTARRARHDRRDATRPTTWRSSRSTRDRPARRCTLGRLQRRRRGRRGRSRSASPLGLQGTVTSGIVSALNRPVTAGGDAGDAARSSTPSRPTRRSTPATPAVRWSTCRAGHRHQLRDRQLPGRRPAASPATSASGFAIPIDQARQDRRAAHQHRQGRPPRASASASTASFTGEGAKLAAGGVQDRQRRGRQAGLKDGDVILEFEGKKVPDADALIVAIRAERRRHGQDEGPTGRPDAGLSRMTLQAASS